MKKRMALLMALVFTCVAIVGLVPMTVGATDYADGATIILPFLSSVTLGTNETAELANSGDSRYVEISSDKTTIRGINSTNNARVEVKIKGTGGSAKTIYIIVLPTTTYSGATINESEFANTTLTVSKGSKTEVFVGETISISAAVKGVTNGTPKYSWTVEGVNGGSADITPSYYGTSATIKITGAKTDGSSSIKVTLTALGNVYASKSIEIGMGKTSAIPLYGGQINFTYYDSETKNIIANPTSTLGAISQLNNLSRSYRPPVGYQVGYSEYIYASAIPTSVTFTKDNAVQNMAVYVKKGRGTSAGYPNYGTSTGYTQLLNGYTVVHAIEASNNIPVLNKGEYAILTSQMLGGVPIDAAGMSYEMADPKIATYRGGIIEPVSPGITTLRVFCYGTEVINKYVYVLGTPAAAEEEHTLTLKPTSVTRTLATQKKYKFRLAAKYVLLDGEKIAHDELNWSSSKTSVATVDEDGFVRIKSKGTCYIYAAYELENGEELTARFKVTVK